MTNQEKIACLRKYREYGAEIERLEEEIARWRAQAEKTTTTIKDVPVQCNGSRDRLQDSVIEIDQIITVLAEAQHDLARTRISIERAISTVAEDRLQRLLRYRYIDGMTWEAIAVKMRYSWRQVIRLHGEALNKVVIECHIRKMILLD